MAALVGSLRADLAQARETNQRLQRRCHAAEGLVAKFNLVEGRPQREQGRSFGRALANYAASLYMRERDEARAVLELIAEAGGTTTEEGLHCNGTWCADQARTFLDTTGERICYPRTARKSAPADGSASGGGS
jgi:hypothetical protein